jgi:oligosaccharide repeat unit polymerase
MYLYFTAALLVVCAGLARILQGSWAAPGAFYALVWVVAAVPAVIVLPHDVSPTAMLFVASFVIAVLVGSQLGGCAGLHPQSEGAAHGDANEGLAVPPTHTLLTTTAILLGLCGIAATVGYVWGAGYSLRDLSRSGTWIRMAVHYSIARYHGGYQTPIVVNLLTAADYAGAIVAGVALAMPGGALRRVAVSLPVIGGVLITIATTAKAAMLIAIISAFAGWLSVRVSAREATRQRRRSWKRLFVVGTIVFGGATLVFVSLMLRYGPGGASQAVILQRIGGYAFGQMAALSAWLHTLDWSALTPRWGEMTFSGLAAVFHIHSRIPGLYDTIDLNGWAAQTNVFTALRGLVMDFGLVGAWGAVALVGAIGGRCYERLRGGMASAGSFMGLIVFYIFSGWNPVVSIFDYNVCLVGIVVAAVVVAIARREISAEITRTLRVSRLSRPSGTAPT